MFKIMLTPCSKKIIKTLCISAIGSLFILGCTTKNDSSATSDNSVFVSQNNSELITSPNFKVSAKVFIDQSGKLSHEVFSNNFSVISPSVLGISIDGINLGTGIKLIKVVDSKVDTEYTTRGNHTLAHNHYNQRTYNIEHISSEKRFQLQVRLYDDGFAYRYIVPSQKVQHVDGESSSWTLPKNSKTWFFERDSNWKLKTYAGWWKSEDISQMPITSSQGPIQGTPLVFELPNDLGYAAITKAALYNYSGMRLKAVGDNTFQANFTEGDKGFDVMGTVTTPWRVTMLAKDLNTLVNSDLITNLNPAPDPVLFADTQYIKPGRSVWSWMSLRLGTIQDQKDFTQYAADIGFKYNLIDAGWKDWPTPWKTLTEITLQGKKRGVENWVWVHSKDIKDPANDYAQMKTYLDKVKAAGAVGVKTDFMNSESKALIDFEITFLQEMARRKLLANFHGSHSPTGESRTYPNELTREGIRGIEVNLHKGQHLPASHNAALPFTRFLMGHGDYTPLYFTNPGATTFAHQLATPIVFLSPVQVYADSPEVLQNNPDINPALDIIKATPTVWDETRVLAGSKIGELAAFGRRSGDKWFVAILNNEQAKDYTLDLAFLDNGNYQAEIVEDDLNSPLIKLKGLNKLAEDKLSTFTQAVPFKVSQKSVNSRTKLKIKLADGGGFVAVFSKD